MRKNESNIQARKTMRITELILRIFVTVCVLVIIGLIIEISDKSDLTIHEISLDSETILEPNFFTGRYKLEPGKVYAIRWDVPFVYSDMGEKVSADINIESAYLVKDGERGTITVDIKDNYREKTYSEELDFVSTSGNIGVEFCADMCRIRAYGWMPEIRDGQFTVCFYTSGEYVAYDQHNRISGPDGLYGYVCRTKGTKSDEDFINRPEREFTGYYLPQQLNPEEPPTPPVAPEPIDGNLSKGIDEPDDNDGNNQSDSEKSDSEISDGGGQSGPELSAGQEFLESPETYEASQKTESPDTPSEATKRTD